MVQSEVSNTLDNLRALGAALDSTRELGGKEAAERAAVEGIKSLEQTEEGKNAILASETHRQAMQELDKVIQEKKTGHPGGDTSHPGEEGAGGAGHSAFQTCGVIGGEGCPGDREGF
jgi:hypothetical protein